MPRTPTRRLITLWTLALFILSGCTFDTSGPEPSGLKEFGVYDLGLDSDMELIDSEVRDLPDSGEQDLADAAPPDLVDMGPPDLSDSGVVDVPMVDMPVQDQAKPVPDIPVPDMPVPDFPVPDMPVADLLVPDMPVPDMSAPDLFVPDMMPPDQSIMIDSGVGGPCPCSGGLVCIYNACRVKCTRDSCRQSSACAASESCTQQGTNLGCLPALSAYAPCQTQPFGCPQGQYCARNISAHTSACPCAPSPRPRAPVPS